MNSSRTKRLAAIPNPRNQGFRFKLRTLFLIVLVSAISTWWIMGPTQKINWFANGVNNGNSNTAKAMVKPFEKDESWQHSLIRHLANGKQVESVKSKTEVSIVPISFADIILGERRFTVVQGHDIETTDGSRQYGYSTANGTITRRGIR